MNALKYILTIIILLLIAPLLPAQQGVSPQEGFQRRTQLDKSTTLPSSPEASSLGQYGEFNLDPYIGSINLQVPVHTIAGKTTSVPINLLYSGMAAKVDNREGWVGLNWNMTANFAITRNVVASPDDEINYYSKKDSITNSTFANKIIENQHLYDVARANIESQPDHYYLSYPGGSQKFYITPSKRIIQKEHKNLTITPTFDLDGDITKFVVLDDKGIAYEYAATENAKLTLDDVAQGEINPARSQYFYNSAFHLTKIIGTNGIETFTFAYESATIAYDLDINPSYYQSTTYPPQDIASPDCCDRNDPPVTTDGLTNTTSISHRKFLTSITYQLGSDTLERVVFESSFRTDGDTNSCLASGQTDKQLDRIRCFKGDKGTVNILNYELAYNYCTTNRLMLESIKEKSADGQECKEPYLFSYDEQLLPNSYVSNSIDHFGYFNGASNTNLIPKITPQNQSQLNPFGANRAPNTTKAKAGILTKVTYPTGGYTEYEWEGHQVAGKNGYTPYAPTQAANIDRFAGGVRIASITHYAEDNIVASKRTYKYEKRNPTANASSSGILLNEPIYYSISKFTTYLAGGIGGGGNCGGVETCERPVIAATSRSSLGTIKGSHVGYTRVEETISAGDGSNAGKVIYTYKNVPFSAANELKDNIENGLLERKEVFNAAGDTLAQTIYIYTEDNRKEEVFTGYQVSPIQEQDNLHLLCQESSGAYVWKLEGEDTGCAAWDIFRSKFERKNTTHHQRWIYQSEMIDTRYFYTGSTLTGKVQTTTNYVYGDTTTNQPTETIVKNSDGKNYKTTTEFVNSYDNSYYPAAGESDAFAVSLKKKGMTSFPLVQTQFIDGALVYRTKLNYQVTSSLLTLPHKLYEEFPNTGDRLAEVFDAYDGVGNLRQGHRHYESATGDSQPVSMIYSHGNSRMAAQIKNADVGEVAYTSFETNEQYQGGWAVPHYDTEIRFNGIARTGNGHYQSFNPAFTGEVISTTVNEGTYILSYYTNSPTNTLLDETGITVLSKKTSTDHPNWTYIEYKIVLDTRKAVNVNISYFVSIDELRLYPADALMNTFAYDKDNRLVVSIQDENALPSRFEYDGLLRLTGVRNFDNHYLSVNEYLYKNNTNANNSIRSWSLLAAKNNETDAKNANSGEVIKVFSYFDGLGRDLQTSSVGTSATQKDQVQFFRYDKFGRQVKQFLPYTATTNGGAFRSNAEAEQQAFISTEYGAANTNFGFIETELELSPLNRVFKQTPQGSDFNSNPTETSYAAIGNMEVRDFHGMGAWFLEDELFKITQRDENGNRVITYTDKIGRKIMQDQEGSKTYFLYNEQGLLEQVIQPDAAQKGHDTPLLYKGDDQIKDGSFLYTYDEEHRLKTKIVPNCAAYTYFYDDLDQLVMTVDGNSFKTFTKYDKLGRPVITGRYTGSQTPSRTAIVFEKPDATAPHYYTTNQAFPTDGMIDIYTVNYYDDYDIDQDANCVEEVTYETNAVTNATYPNYSFVRGLPTFSKIAILKNDGSTPDTYLSATSFYDQFRRVIHSRKDNHLGGQDKVWNNFNFAGWLLQTQRVHQTDIVGQITTKTINERWEYDHIGRELQYYHEIEGDQAEKLVCEKTYNERDELITKKLGNTIGNNFLQTVNYTYNIRKWLTSINDPKNLGSDLFGMILRYDGILQLGDTPNYNGNISSITWKNSSDDIEKTYKYNYDNLNRLTDANYSQVAPNVNSLTSSNDQYNADYTYDANGNIKTLTRNGLMTNNTFGQIDNLAYTYADDGALTNLAESSEKTNGFKSKTAGGAGAYTYDQNGNMLTDAHKDMTVEYNFLNLPTKVTKPEGTIEWIYDAAGTKLSKTVTTDHLEVNVNPIFSKEYKASMTIESNGNVPNMGNVTFTAGQSITLKEGFTATAGSDFLARIMPNNVVQVRDYCSGIEYFESQLEAIYHTDGRIKYTGGNSERNFYLSDYQGNIRILFRDDNSIVKSIEEYDGYYPFGAIHSQQSDYQQKYFFGGKELQTELDLGWSDFGPRCFDNWKARWEGIDIMSDVAPESSPYSYTMGNPVRYSDPTGMLTEDKDGLITTSTSLWGRDATGGENSGEIGRQIREEARKPDKEHNNNDSDPDPTEVWKEALGKYFENESILQVLDYISSDRMLRRKFPELREVAHKTAEALGAFKLIQSINQHTNGEEMTIDVGGYPVTFKKVQVLMTKYSTYQINEINFNNFTAMIQMGGEAGFRGQVKGVKKSYSNVNVKSPEIAWVIPTPSSNRHLGIGQTFYARKFARLVISQSYPLQEEKIMNRLKQVKAFSFQNINF